MIMAPHPLGLPTVKKNLAKKTLIRVFLVSESFQVLQDRQTHIRKGRFVLNNWLSNIYIPRMMDSGEELMWISHQTDRYRLDWKTTQFIYSLPQVLVIIEKQIEKKKESEGQQAKLEKGLAEWKIMNEEN